MRTVLFGAAAATCIAGAASAQETQTYAYDVHGRLTAVTRTTGATARTTTYTLDNADNRTSRLLGAPTASGAMTAPQSGDAIAADTGVAPSEPEPEPSAEDTGAAPDSAVDPDAPVEPASDTPAA